MAQERYETIPRERTAQRGELPSDDAEDFLGGGPAQTAAAVRPRQPANGSSKGQFAFEDVIGDPPVSTTTEFTETEAGAHQEVRSEDRTESADYIEASPGQLAAAESGEETAVSDLRGIPGFEETESGEERPTAVQAPLRDAGAAAQGRQEEFLPILTALAPTLISTIGPSVAKAIVSRLSTRVRRVITQVPKPAIPPSAIGTALTGVLSAVQGGPTSPAPTAAGASSLMALIAQLLQAASQAPVQAGGESGVGVQESFVQEAAAAIEAIIGTDDRLAITQTTLIPWRMICALRIQFASGATYRGTGFLIGPRAVATAGHCVYLHDQGGWARSIEVIPGCNGSVRPFGQVEATSFRSVGGWVSGKKPESDYGCVVLPNGAFGSRNLGSFGVAAYTAPELLAHPAVVAGYPGDKPFAQMWGMARVIKGMSATVLNYEIDTMGGQSGAPVYVKRNGRRYVVGIHNYGSSTGNSATRVTQPVYQQLLAWSQI